MPYFAYPIHTQPLVVHARRRTRKHGEHPTMQHMPACGDLFNTCKSQRRGLNFFCLFSAVYNCGAAPLSACSSTGVRHYHPLLKHPALARPHQRRCLVSLTPVFHTLETSRFTGSPRCLTGAHFCPHRRPVPLSFHPVCANYGRASLEALHSPKVNAGSTAISESNKKPLRMRKVST